MLNENFISKMLDNLKFFCQRWPFDWKTPFGFLIAFTVQFVADICIQIWLIPTAGLFIGVCWLSIAFAGDIASDVRLLNVGKTANHNQIKWTEGFCKIIQRYGDARQLSVNSEIWCGIAIINIFITISSQHNRWVQSNFRINSNRNHIMVSFFNVYSSIGISCGIGKVINLLKKHQSKFLGRFFN